MVCCENRHLVSSTLLGLCVYFFLLCLLLCGGLGGGGVQVTQRVAELQLENERLAEELQRSRTAALTEAQADEDGSQDGSVGNQDDEAVTGTEVDDRASSTSGVGLAVGSNNDELSTTSAEGAGGGSFVVAGDDGVAQSATPSDDSDAAVNEPDNDGVAQSDGGAAVDATDATDGGDGGDDGAEGAHSGESEEVVALQGHVAQLEEMVEVLQAQVADLEAVVAEEEEKNDELSEEVRGATHAHTCAYTHTHMHMHTAHAHAHAHTRMRVVCSPSSRVLCLCPVVAHVGWCRR